MKNNRDLIILSDMIDRPGCPDDRIALDIDSLAIIHIRMSPVELGVMEDISLKDYPVCINVMIENCHGNIWNVNSVRLATGYDDEKIRKILSAKASYPYRFIDGSVHSQYGLGRLQSFDRLLWSEKRLWMKDSLIAGTNVSKTVALKVDGWKEMMEDCNRNVLEKHLHDWSNDVFCVMVRPNVNRVTYCYTNLLIIRK